MRQLRPSTRARPPASPRRRDRFRGFGARERWGYGVWLLVGLVFGIPESWAGIGNPPWPALSETVGHLESLWSPVAVIVVALIVFAAFNAVSYPLGHAGEFPARGGGPGGRTANGRLARSPDAVSVVPTFVYFPVALGVVAGGSLLAATASSDKWVLGYAIYGLFALFLVVIRTRARRCPRSAGPA
jgi:hypothetical protein